ncbi:phage tail protein [Pseudomonas sp. CBSPBW29]|uniref:phage tail protein n=1 Tax=unclassified Pseudomonas TaxID=196821 RepID=UPI000937FE32|nr:MULTISPECIES: phage tail protein [unclassified Pseudomonas]WEL43175.1 phage tail protein [Pseudomonas sp. CBSPBW29]WEL64243.1 phage tail protein [Pseudomonas sp. CBSPGW29]WEL73423.1 phage tail protein [Pseudomonas sp. CBSPCGW29]WEL74741.1 phage tail protein [Pseudomonas sp. CBSPAW29]WEL81017.1 phage tail protein [Pseudomonas sp. CBSPCAW29]WEL89524.1 phage tail protein [Pseudomonas sp. CBSPCBW29]
MAYMEQLLSGLKYLVEAGEAGRRSADGMLGPVNSAISELTGAASELENIPFVGPSVGAKLQRVMRGVDAAQSKVGQVVAVYGRATRAATEVQERMGALKEQAGKAATAINKIAGNVSPSLANIVPTSAFATDATPAPEAVKPFPHLLIIQPRDPKEQPYYFNLDTAAFDELSRSTEFRWASQERLSRRPAQQAVGMGDEKLTLKGTIYPGFKGGLKQLDTLRSIGARLQPLSLTTGYGDVIGTWCLKSINEEQGALLHGGIPRKQGFSLEFVRYGDDMQNV